MWIGPVERHVGEKKQADQPQLAQVKLYQTEKHVDEKNLNISDYSVRHIRVCICTVYTHTFHVLYEVFPTG